MPLPIQLAHRITHRLAEVRKADVLPYLRPDGKAQVTVRYEVDEHGRQRPVEIERVLISTQHRDGLDAETMIKPDLIDHVLRPILPHDLYDEKRFGDRDFVYVNPTGKFVIGGPMGDTGLDRPQDHRRHLRGRRPARGRRVLGQGSDEGRPLGRICGAVRGEERRRGRSRRALPDPGRVRDRGRASAERAGRLLRHQRRRSQQTIETLVGEHFDLRPGAIIRDLDLRRPIYQKTAAYGHFGREEARLHLGADGQGRRSARAAGVADPRPSETDGRGQAAGRT